MQEKIDITLTTNPMSTIRGLTKKETASFLVRVNQLIEENPTVTKFAKPYKKVLDSTEIFNAEFDSDDPDDEESQQIDEPTIAMEVADLPYSLLKASNGSYFILGDKEKNFVGKGSFSEARIVYPLVLNENGQYILGTKPTLLKKARHESDNTNYLEHMDKTRFINTRLFEDKDVTFQKRRNRFNQDKFYLFQEKLPGLNTSEALAQGQLKGLSLAELVPGIINFLSHLDNLHTNKYIFTESATPIEAVHCDIKAGNTLWDSASRTIRVIDHETAIPIDANRLNKGTPLYFSPELKETTVYAHPAQDVYAAALTILEILGRGEITYRDILANRIQYIKENPTEDKKEAAHIPPELLFSESLFDNDQELVSLVKKYFTYMLNKKPEKRPTCAQAKVFFEALNNYTRQPSGEKALDEVAIVLGNFESYQSYKKQFKEIPNKLAVLNGDNCAQFLGPKSPYFPYIEKRNALIVAYEKLMANYPQVDLLSPEDITTFISDSIVVDMLYLNYCNELQALWREEREKYLAQFAKLDAKKQLLEADGESGDHIAAEKARILGNFKAYVVEKFDELYTTANNGCPSVSQHIQACLGFCNKLRFSVEDKLVQDQVNNQARYVDLEGLHVPRTMWGQYADWCFQSILPIIGSLIIYLKARYDTSVKGGMVQDHFTLFRRKDSVNLLERNTEDMKNNLTDMIDNKGLGI